MSYRILRKLQGNELEIKDPIDEISDGADADYDTNSVGSQTRKKININRFDLLNQQQSLSESEVKEDDNDDTERDAAGGTQNTNLVECKKKKRTGRYVANSARRSSEDNADVEDDFAKTVKEVDQLFVDYGKSENSAAVANRANGTGDEAGPSFRGGKSLLTIQHKNLNPQYEMKRMFGSKVVADQQNKRRNNRGAPRTLKSTYLVNPKGSWPPLGESGLIMNLVQAPEQSVGGTSKGIFDKNVIYFEFEHSFVYRHFQQKFLIALIESSDSDTIIKIINQYPYLVDSLIQLSELCKMSEDHAMASDLIEHALFALESSFHTMFSLTQGTCRLDYRRQENRALFITLFKHSQYLESRACSRTALEVAKLILTFDPVNDPLAIILMIDFYAIRAKQYDWLVQLYDEWEATNNLSQLPNMAYSYSLALFLLKRTEAADRALQYALLMFPSVLRLLLDELGIQPDSRVIGHSYFAASTYDKATVALQQLTSMYVCRSKLVWRDTEILPWLERNVSTVLDRVDNKDEIVAEYTAKRNQRYMNPPRAILRHIVLSDFKEKVPLAQFIKKETEPVLMYDPLPPLDSINIYSRPSISPTTRNLINASPFSMFFQSLLPSFSLQQQAQQQQPGQLAIRNREAGEGPAAAAAPAAGDGAIAGLQAYTNSLNSIVDAMRDFLSDIRVLERPNDADVDDNESSDGDEQNDYLT